MHHQITSQSAIDDYRRILQGSGIYLQHHVPEAMDAPYHVHASIEINFLENCDMDYSFGGQTVRLPRERFCIFWAAQPHRVLNVHGQGKITNAYISLEEFLSWPLPENFVDAVLGGGVAVAPEMQNGDSALAERLAREVGSKSDQMSRLHCLEMQTRITRMALTEWELVAPLREATTGSRTGGNAIVHFDKMLRFIAMHYAEPISLAQVAAVASVSANYANTLFKKIIGTTVKAHIISVRVYSARMLLAETDRKIISISLDCGFRSLSSFYAAFQQLVGVSPAKFRSQLGCAV